MTSSRSKPRPSAKARQRAARLAAVQAIYQVAITGIHPKAAVEEFMTYRAGQEIDGELYVTPAPELLRAIVEGAGSRAPEIEDMVKGALGKSHDSERLEELLRSILRAGIWELLENDEAPVGVIINEYIEVTKAFYGGSEPSLINGALDSMAKVLRPHSSKGGEPA